MKIIHLCLANYYQDNYSYQENMLPKFHYKLGYEVEIIASQFSFDENGGISYSQKPGNYVNEHGIKVTRLEYKKPIVVYRKMRRFVGLGEALNESKPDIIFMHGCQFLDIGIVVKYLKLNPKVIVYVDNHADVFNSASNWISLNILHKIIWKRCANKIATYARKFYGVLPARVDFLTNVYGLSRDKVDLLLMGADDELVENARDSRVICEIRKKHNILPGDFLIITGGKIDARKTQTLLLMEAVGKIADPAVKLIVYGSVTLELKRKFDALVKGIKVQYIGWIQASDIYKYFAASNLVVFPGGHSVLWEQATGQGIPIVVKEWSGMHHIDLGGNVEFLKEDSMDEIYDVIMSILNDSAHYNHMREVASKGMLTFSYQDIAKRSIEHDDRSSKK